VDEVVFVDQYRHQSEDAEKQIQDDIPDPEIKIGKKHIQKYGNLPVKESR
jgi:hypothetical protein